jgi:2-polyprenyl-3-methyl-5-hydroxy-6-metoxy-1,4-benzoquinol methylase
MVTLTHYPETADIETSSEEYARRFAGEIGTWFLSIQEEATLKMLLPYQKASILDVGGGHGQLAAALVDEGHHVTVLGSAEICGRRIQRLINSDRCSFKVGNILDLPFPDQSIDVVISFRLLSHVTGWKDFLSELARVARKAVILDYPEVKSVNIVEPYFFGIKKNLEGNTRSFKCFREADLIAFFNSMGFSYGQHFREFFLPMVLHRKLSTPKISLFLERLFRRLGFTEKFGSPAILKVVREKV